MSGFSKTLFAAAVVTVVIVGVVAGLTLTFLRRHELEKGLPSAEAPAAAQTGPASEPVPAPGAPDTDAATPSLPERKGEENTSVGDELIEKLRQKVLQGAYGNMPAEDLFAEYLGATGPAHKEALILAMLFRKGEFLPLVLAILRAGSTEEKEAVMRLLQCARWPEALPTIVALLRDKSESEIVRVGAIGVLSKLRDRKTTGILLETLAREGTIVEKQAALLALSAFRDTGIAESVRPWLSDQDARTRLCAAVVLIQIGEREAMDVVIEASRSENDQLRREAIRALGFLGGEDAIRRLGACPNNTISLDSRK